MKEWEIDPAENRKENTLFYRREHLERHSSYASERIEYNAIREGQTEIIENIFLRVPDGTPGILSSNELRNSKNKFITAITLYTRAAIEGGLQEETAYAMSDGFIQTAESMEKRESIEELQKTAALRFAGAVKQYGQPHYSRIIVEAVKYIHLHLHTPITLTKVAGEVGISQFYLSRLFKEETGMSMVDYIQKERIEAAMNMLKYSDYSAAEISQYLCFSTQSYFIRIFKKYTGMTPRQYQKKGGFIWEESAKNCTGC